jgi:N-methylhydantoinase A
MTADGGYMLGVDIGGTFSDIVCRGSGREIAFKVPTTTDDPSRAVATALSRLAAEYEIPANLIVSFVHGTTVSTNALIERTGARVGLIMTEGFGDTIEIGRQIRRQLYDLALKPETPGWLAPGARRAEVSERIAADGTVVKKLDEVTLTAAIERLAAQGVESIGVCLLFSFNNPAHEIRVRERLAELLPDVSVSLSHEVDPAFREYERTVATAFDAYVKPIVDTYLARLQLTLREAGSPATVHVMQSRGGLSGVATARARPIRLTLSGPAAGVIGAKAEGQASGYKDILSIDIGGTSSDIAMIRDGQSAITSEADIGGYKVRVPMLDIVTLGAGGGSIAWLDAAGGLKVGPQSAGAEPGPACYGHGGMEPTVTDASVVLGYLNPAYFAGGTMELETELARRAIKDRIADPMNLSVEHAAAGIHRIANAHMADGIRLVSLKRGYDPRDFALLGLGGGGGIHAVAVADEMGSRHVIIPRRPGVLSASGLLAASIEHEVPIAYNRPIDEIDVSLMRSTVDRLHSRASQLMVDDGLDASAAERYVSADLAYTGQSYALTVPLAIDADNCLARAYADFESEHERINGLATGAPVKFVNLRVVHRIPPKPSDAVAVSAGRKKSDESRLVSFAGQSAIEARVLDRSQIEPNTHVDGPAVIEQRDATTLLPPGWRGSPHASGALVLERTAG